ncbi:hypothetical protein FQA39_LY14592 [Lamprigera yunnana]|nr:hypothetical protein FQA39_LY14592 [Lamprigera yunnana]
MEKELIEHVTSDWNNNSLRAIVLAAEGAVFSSGHNLKEFNVDQGEKCLMKEVFKMSTKLMLSIVECPVPVIACVNGVAAAAGCQLVSQCDIVVCSEKSMFSTPGANFGVFCSTPGIPLSRVVSRKTALHMLLTGFPLVASDAKLAGLVSVVCPENELEREVDKICKSIIAKSRYTIAAGKRFYYQQVELELKKAYTLGEEEMTNRIKSIDGQEGVKSFAEKRSPEWKHFG